VQVNPFESKGLKPGNHLIGSRLNETMRFQAMGHNWIQLALRPTTGRCPALGRNPAHLILNASKA
jgi:hypothetical protein